MCTVSCSRGLILCCLPYVWNSSDSHLSFCEICMVGFLCFHVVSWSRSLHPEPSVCLHVTMSMHTDGYLFHSKKWAGIQPKQRRKTRKIIKVSNFLTKIKPSNLIHKLHTNKMHYVFTLYSACIFVQLINSHHTQLESIWKHMHTNIINNSCHGPNYM